MAVITLVMPQKNEHIHIQNTDNTSFDLTFPASAASAVREGEDLIFRFADGSSITVHHFYLTFSAEQPAVFTMYGQAMSSDAYSALPTNPGTTPPNLTTADDNTPVESDSPDASGQDTPPSAVPAASSNSVLGIVHNGNFQHAGNIELIHGIDKFDGLDLGFKTSKLNFYDVSGAWPDNVSDADAGAGNQAPVVSISGELHLEEAGVVKGGNQSFAGTSLASGQVVATDADNGTLSYAFIDATGQSVTTLSTPYGVMHMGADGVYTFTLNNDGAEALNLGQNHVENFTALVDDGQGGQVRVPVRVTIDGANDRPTLHLSDHSLRPLADDDAAVVTGMAAGHDNDTSSTLVYTLTHPLTGAQVNELHDAYGVLRLDPATGAYSYTLDANSAAVLALKAGDTPATTVTVTVTDEHGAFSRQDLTVTVNGANNAPILTTGPVQPLTVYEAGLADGAPVGNPTQTQSFTLQDYDTNTALVTTLCDANGQPLTNVTVDPSGVMTHTTTHGMLTVTPTTHPDGSVTYTTTFVLNDAASDVNGLSPGESLLERYVLKVTDDEGAALSQEVRVTINGSNDGPTLAPLTTTVTEAGVKGTGSNDGNTPFAGADVEGSLAAAKTDVDTNDTHTYALLDNTGQAVTSLSTAHGIVILNAATGEYTYTLNNANLEVNALNVGEYLTDTLAVRVTDSHGVSADSTLTVRVDGTNDRPDITAYDTSLTATEGAFSAVKGQITATAENDAHDTKSYWITTNGVDSATLDSTYTTLDGKYGTLSINTTSGEYTYQLKTSLEHYNEVVALRTGQSLTDEVFNLVLRDANGAFVIKPITVVVNGKNTPPSFADGEAYALDVTEKGVEWQNNTPLNGTATDNGTPTVVPTDAHSIWVFSLSDPHNLAESTVVDANGHILSITTQYGTISIDPNTGKYTYDLNNNGAVNAIQNGANETETFGIVVTDTTSTTPGATDASSTRDITVTITGTNDRPVVTSPGQNATLVEDSGTFTATGTIQGADPEDGKTGLRFGLVESTGQAVGTEVQTLEGKYGYLQLNATKGTWEYHLDNAKIQFLSEGQSPAQGYAEEFIVRVTDADNAYSDTAIAIAITGKDDNVTMQSVTRTVTEDTGVGLDGNITLTGILTSTDVDMGDTVRTYTLTGGTPDADGSMTLAGTYGTLTVKSDGSYSYVMTKNGLEAVQKLNVGDNLNPPEGLFPITVTSGNGSDQTTTAGANITITITGSNDNPVLTLNTEQTSLAVTGHDLSEKCVDTGTLSATDIDDSDANLVFRFVNEHGAGTQPDQNATGNYGSITITTAGVYTYTLNLLDLKTIQDYFDANPSATDLTETFHVTVTDPHGASDTENLVISIPKDKIPTPPPGPGPDIKVTDIITSALVATEDGNASDILTGKVTASLSNGTTVPENADYQFAFKVTDGKGGYAYVQSVATEWGTITLNPKTGEYTYTLNNASNLVQALAANFMDNATYTVCVFDKYYQEVPDINNQPKTGSIGLTLHGANDAPKILAAPDLSVVKNSAGTDSDKPEVTDVDKTTTSNTLTYSYTFKGQTFTADTSQATTYGTLTVHADGSYAFVLDPTNAVLLALGAGDHLDETFTLQVSDGTATTTKDITITINGANDKPDISFTTAPGGTVLSNGNLAFTEDGTGTVSGFVTGHDINANDTTLTYSLTNSAGSSAVGILAGKYGTVVMNAATGEYTYTLNNALTAVQSLGDGETLTETLYVKVSDQHGGSTFKPYDVVVTGTNDAPTLKVDTPAFAIREGPTAPVLSGKATAQDVDVSDQASLHYGFNDGTAYVGTGSDAGFMLKDGTYGTFRIHIETGDYTYTLNKALAEGLGDNVTRTDSVTVTVMDQHVACIDPSDVTVTITGANTAPTLTLSSGGSSLEVAKSTAVIDKAMAFGTASAADVDKDTHDAPDDVLRFGVKVDGIDSPIAYIEDGATEAFVQGQYGKLTIHSDGTYTYTPTATIEDLVEGQKVSDSFKLVVNDSHNINGTTMETVTVNLTGSDEPVVPPNAPTLIAFEPAPLSDTPAPENPPTELNLFNLTDLNTSLEEMPLTGLNEDNPSAEALADTLVENFDTGYVDTNSIHEPPSNYENDALIAQRIAAENGTL